MEKLIQRYAQKFDIVMIAIILLQLIDAIYITLTKCIRCDAVISVILSVINIILLSNSLTCNKKQQFIEWKVNAKILRYTIGLFILFHVIVCMTRGFNMLEMGAHLMNFLAVETVLTYRIDSIRHLESLANQYARERGGK